MIFELAKRKIRLKIVRTFMLESNRLSTVNVYNIQCILYTIDATCTTYVASR